MYPINEVSEDRWFKPAISQHERRSIALARSLFSRWLEQVVSVPGVAPATDTAEPNGASAQSPR
jgi:hypothetical protein